MMSLEFSISKATMELTQIITATDRRKNQPIYGASVRIPDPVTQIVLRSTVDGRFVPPLW